MNCDRDFAPLIKEYLPEKLLTSEDTIYGLRPDLTLVYFNQGWTQFAMRNGGEPMISRDWHIGRNVEDAIPSVLKPFFHHNFAKCLAENRPWEHEYECSSAELYRRFLMRVYPLKNAQGLLIVNSSICESHHSDEAGQPQEEIYRNTDGLIIQCCHCRRIRRIGVKKAWDRVPEWTDKCPRDTSHGICEPCFGFFYGDRLSRKRDS